MQVTVEIGDARLRSIEERQTVVNEVFEWWARRGPECLLGSTLVIRMAGVPIFKCPR